MFRLIELENNSMIRFKRALVFSSAIMIASALWSCNESKKSNNSENIVLTEYQCPMRCEDEKTYKKEGKCPVCKMDIKEIK